MVRNRQNLQSISHTTFILPHIRVNIREYQSYLLKVTSFARNIFIFLLNLYKITSLLAHKYKLKYRHYLEFSLLATIVLRLIVAQHLLRKLENYPIRLNNDLNLATEMTLSVLLVSILFESQNKVAVYGQEPHTSI